MADFGIGSQSGGDSGGGGFEDPGASSFGGQDAFDPSALGMGGGGWSPFGGGGGGGGGFGGASSPSQTAGTAFDPAAQSAQQANQQQQQQQPNKPPSRGSQLEDAIKSLFGGAQHAMSPSLQSLASTARTGMGWFNNAAKSTATPDALSPTPSDQGPINDPSTAIGDLPSGGTGSPSQDVHDMMGDLRKMFGLQAPQAQTAGASTGPTGNEATQAAQEPAGGPAGGATGDFTPAAVPQLAPPADPAAQVGAAQQDPAAAAAPPAPDTSSAATPPPQSAPTSGENNQPGPGDQVT
ncbi:MAG TPA: hypothetical protein VHT52_05225, partial [Stellaceae bacterium]|nr:hypothetical protein [Stellaceae bacterium]